MNTTHRLLEAITGDDRATKRPGPFAQDTSRTPQQGAARGGLFAREKGNWRSREAEVMSDQKIVKDERGQDQPTDKKRAQQTNQQDAQGGAGQPQTPMEPEKQGGIGGP